VDTAAGLIYARAELAHNEPSAVKHGDRLVTVRKTRKKDGTVIEAGVSGEVCWTGSFGAFHHNGYNRPNRSNTRVGLRLLDGSVVFVGLSACRRDGELEPLDAIRIRLVALMAAGQFEIMPLTSCTAWLTSSYWQ
jgi:hypothetical protein